MGLSFEDQRVLPLKEFSVKELRFNSYSTRSYTTYKVDFRNFGRAVFDSTVLGRPIVSRGTLRQYHPVLGAESIDPSPLEIGRLVGKLLTATKNFAAGRTEFLTIQPVF